MIFSTLHYVAFFVVLLILYYTIRPKAQWIILLTGSILFLGYFSINFVLYSLIYVLVNYIIARILGESKNDRNRLFAYNIGIYLNIGLLAFYKYINFIISNVLGLVNIFTDDIHIPYKGIGSNWNWFLYILSNRIFN